MDVPPGSGWVVERELGSGAFGTTKLLRTPTGELYAVKYLQRGKKILDSLAYVEREIKNQMQLTGHPHVVGFRGVFVTGTHLGILMEYAAGGQLFDVIRQAGRFSEDVARYFFQQLISGVAWCHSNGVCHRDLKLENTLLELEVPPHAVASLQGVMTVRPRIKICDFGYSKSSQFDSQPKSRVGTPAYIAPEVLSRQTQQYQGEAADVWSCGVTLYVMLVGAYPFEDPDDPKNFKKTIDRITAVQYSIPANVLLTPECRDLLCRIFVADPNRRISIPQIRQHPWYLRNLPPEMHGNDQAMVDGAPQFSQTEEQIDEVIKQACTAGTRMMEPTQELQEYMGNMGRSISFGEQYVNQYMDGDPVDDELMLQYMRSRETSGAGRQGHAMPQYPPAGAGMFLGGTGAAFQRPGGPAAGGAAQQGATNMQSVRGDPFLAPHGGMQISDPELAMEIGGFPYNGM